MTTLDAKRRMERILRLHSEIDDLKSDIRDVYAEEKAAGGDKTAMGAAVSIIRKRAKDKDTFDERTALTDTYLTAFYGSAPSHTHAREAENHDPETGEIVERRFEADEVETTFSVAPDQVNVRQSAYNETNPAPPMYYPDRLGAGDEPQPSSPVAQGSDEALSIASQPIQPETVKLLGTVADAMQTDIGRQALIKAVDVMIEREEQDETPLPEVPADFKTDRTPDEVAASMRRTLKLRPGCKRPWSCGRYGDQSECGQCLKAAQEEGQAA